MLWRDQALCCFSRASPERVSGSSQTHSAPGCSSSGRRCRTGKTAVLMANTSVHCPVTSQGVFQPQGMSRWPRPHQWRWLQQHKEAVGSRAPWKPHAQCDFMSCRRKWQVTQSMVGWPGTHPQAHPGITNPWTSPRLDPHFSAKDVIFLHAFWQISLRLEEKVYNSQLFSFSTYINSLWRLNRGYLNVCFTSFWFLKSGGFLKNINSKCGTELKRYKKMW